MRTRGLVPLLVGLLLGTSLVLWRGVALPEVAAACSCIGPQPLEAYAGPDTAIFAGQVVGDDSDGVRVAVEQWFSGTGAAPVVLIEGDFGNGASCGVGARPPVGSRWIWVAWRPQGEGIPNLLGGLQINICQPFADLSTPEGAAMLAEAIATFGEAGPPSPGAESPAPTPEPPATPGKTVPPTASPLATEPPATPGESTPTTGGGPSGETVALAAVGGVLLLGVVVLLAALVVGRRARSAGG